MIEIEGLSKWYGSHQVLTTCSVRVAKGETVVVCGPSGSGKSTLLKCINGLERFQQGEVFFNGTPVGASSTNLPRMRAKIGMVFQNFELFPHMTALQNVCLGQERVLRRSREDSISRGMVLLDRVGLGTHAHKYPAQLSGGQAQRVAIARRRARHHGAHR